LSDAVAASLTNRDVVTQQAESDSEAIHALQ
jgi:hypothetical protein